MTVDLAAIATATGICAVAGDTAFATGQSVRVPEPRRDRRLYSRAGHLESWPLELAGTTPTIKDRGRIGPWPSTQKAGLTIDGSHKTITVTPTAGGVLALSIGGA